MLLLLNHSFDFISECYIPWPLGAPVAADLCACALPCHLPSSLVNFSSWLQRCLHPPAMASLPNLDEVLFGSPTQKAAQVSVLIPKPPLPSDLAQLVSHATTNERISVVQGEMVAVIVLVRPPALPFVSEMWHNYFSHMAVTVRVLQPLDHKVNIGQKQATHKFLGAPAALDSVNLAPSAIVQLNPHGDVTSCYTSRLMGV
jgi:hypothetical protein